MALPLLQLGGGTGGGGNSFSLNGSTGSASLVAGPGISLSLNASTITISNSAQFSTISLSGVGNTTVSASGTINNVLSVSGAGIVSVGISNNNLTISASTPSVTNFSTITATMAGNTLGGASTTVTIGNSFSLSGAGIASVGASGGTITISASTPAVVSSLNGSTGAMSVSAGAGIGIGQANSTITISASVQTSSLTINALGNTTNSTSAAISNLLNVSGAGNISVGMSGSTLTISNSPAFISYTQNFDFAEAAPVSVGVLTASGSTFASATNNPFGSSMSLQRMLIPKPMKLSEVDLAFGINFPATNSGQGTMSQTFMMYTFGNSTSLGSFLSASRTASWASGTSTSGTASTLQQGWGGAAGGQSNWVQPFTFASTSVAASEYVFAHLLSWAISTTNWTISVYGANANATTTASAVTNVTSATLSGASSAASTAVTAFTAAPTTVSCWTQLSLQVITCWTGAPNTLAVLSNAFTSAVGLVSGTGATSTSYTSSTQATATNLSVQQYAVFTHAPTQASPFGQANTGVASVVTMTQINSSSVLANAGTAALSLASSAASIAVVTNVGTATASSTLATSSLPAFAYNGTFGMTTSSTQASYLSGPFSDGIFLTGSSAASLDLRSTAATVTGSIALVQPWFALAGN